MSNPRAYMPYNTSWKECIPWNLNLSLFSSWYTDSTGEGDTVKDVTEGARAEMMTKKEPVVVAHMYESRWSFKCFRNTQLSKNNIFVGNHYRCL
jgi:hypothetical protein